MLDFDAGKLVIIGVVALLVIGPKELPRVLRQAGQWTGKMRRMANEFRGQFMEAMREADLENIKNEVAGLANSAQLNTTFDPVGDIHREITTAVDSKPKVMLPEPATDLAALAPSAPDPIATLVAAKPGDAAAASDAGVGPVAEPVVDQTAAPTVGSAVETKPSSRNGAAQAGGLRMSRPEAAAAAAKARAEVIAAATFRRRPGGAALNGPPAAAPPKPKG